MRWRRLINLKVCCQCHDYVATNDILDEDQEQDDKDQEEEDDRKMGEVDDDNQNIVDENLWFGSDEEGEFSMKFH